MPAKWKMLKIKSLWQKRFAEFYIQISFSWGLGWLWATNLVWNFRGTQWEDLPLYKIHTLQGHCTTSCLLSTRRYCCLLGQPTIANVLAPGEVTWFSIGKWKVLEDAVQVLQFLKPSLQQRAVHEHCSSPRQPQVAMAHTPFRSAYQQKVLGTGSSQNTDTKPSHFKWPGLLHWSGEIWRLAKL